MGKNKQKENSDLIIIDDKDFLSAVVKIQFDGFHLKWSEGGKIDTYQAFSGLEDESAKESIPNEGPTPQGKYAIDPTRIQDMRGSGGAESIDWGSYRVPLEPYKSTVDRMVNCFKVIRTSMYIHGGRDLGTIGCIEINDNSEELDFFSKLSKSKTKIEVEVKYIGTREKKYEESKCPY